ncbi:hypothetical protein QE152_g26337 [Popillia japonica]|uniref:Uncharacterized protein n=1 Tax=Popillia japonica TaxID=7064 RepID=A0AAW1JZ55_POPJA
MSLKFLQKANEVSPDDTDIQKEISSLTSLIKKQRVSEKELAQRMFNMKDNGNQKKRKKFDSKFQALTMFGASVIVGLVGFVMYKYKYV